MRHFLFIFSLFEQRIQFKQQIIVKKCSSLYQLLGLEPTTLCT